ncbi:MAG: acetoacetate--CoA ligase [Acidimicrobiaceae bacterium]|nr:acetoacetate--CoA ligase [Acidimicrobiaceae bacterium]
MNASGSALWSPSAARADRTNMAAFAARHGFATYEELHAWSVAKPDVFWAAAWDELGMVGDRGNRIIEGAEPFWKTRFFPDASLNVAENLLASVASNQPALLSFGEDPSFYKEISGSELRLLVGRLQVAMRRAGVGPGDCVAAWLPHIIETVAVMLATASIGAVFTSTSPDFGVDGVVDRFGQVKPKLLFACDAYSYNGKTHDRLEPLGALRAALPSVEQTVVVPHLGDGGLRGAADAVALDDFVDGIEPTEPTFTRFGFDHPWYVLFSSGTTGKPKCIVHRSGGVLLKHLVEHQLHCDIRSGDRVFYYTTAGWMMWNWQVSSLASGATLVLYDGAPMYPDGNRLFDLADSAEITLFGTSAKFIEALGKSDLRPVETHDLTSVRTMTSTGSPLSPEGFRTVYERVKPDLHLASISGGTDLCGCLVAGDPTSPVYAGEIQRAALGLDIDVVDELGNSLDAGVRGELVCRNAFPSMPLGFGDDPDGARYKAAYFQRIPGVWHQGDFAVRTEHGGFIIHGRSDSTLNPGGVRIGTAEIYRQLDKVPEVVESVVIGQRHESDTRIVCFVVLAEGSSLDEELTNRIKTTVRTGATPRHVPAVIGQVSEIPRTSSGKIVELAVKAVVDGDEVTNTEALANPKALDEFRNHSAFALSRLD